MFSNKNNLREYRSKPSFLRTNSRATPKYLKLNSSNTHYCRCMLIHLRNSIRELRYESETNYFRLQIKQDLRGGLTVAKTYF